VEDKLETCKNCAYWPGTDEASGIQPLRGIADVKYGPRPCKHPKFTRGYGSRWDRVDEVAYTPDCAVVENDEGWGIETGPDFGCIHWQVKEPF
jgi:hypothetical protein